VFEIGNSLREARLRQGLDFPEIEQRTKIRGKYLRALEEEQFDLLPGQTYVKGFLRSYAEYLGLDGQLYVDEFNSRYVTGEEEPVIKPRRSEPIGRRSRARAGESRGIILALAGIAAVTALVIAAWRAAPENEQPTIPNLGAGTNAGKSQRQQQPKAPKVTLVASAARGNTWLEIHRNSPAGRTIYRGTLEAGQSRSFTGPRLWVYARAPGNLRVKINGRVRPRLPGRGAPRAFLITPRKFRSVRLAT
jgi:cytoskeleton protein RodZ